MAAFSLATLLGIRPSKPSYESARSHTDKPHEKDKKTMLNFDHLKPGANIRPGADEQYQNQNTQQRLDQDVSRETAAPTKHSRAHNVAVSDEAKENPVLAIRLLKTTDFSSKKIKAQLVDAPQALSKFTQGYMEENDPTWEFQDDEEQALTASMYSAQNGDKNGYHAARVQASKSLEKMVEPMTVDEVQALIARTSQMLNDANPETPDNIAARRQADAEYNDTVAKAAAQRNAKFRATGKALPGDSKRVDGKAATPLNEAKKIKAQLDAGMPAPGILSQ
ncbi:hypothetical protein [Acerihabitans sp.]|uniref:hypothetical protein n=1 Tax=Acerihabitans sp. TaxID=2811394 RepID=UPI002EDB9B54